MQVLEKGMEVHVSCCVGDTKGRGMRGETTSSVVEQRSHTGHGAQVTPFIVTHRSSSTGHIGRGELGVQANSAA